MGAHGGERGGPERTIRAEFLRTLLLTGTKRLPAAARRHLVNLLLPVVDSSPVKTDARNCS